MRGLAWIQSADHVADQAQAWHRYALALGALHDVAEDGIDFLAADLAKRDGWKGLLDGAIAKLGTISLFVHAASPRRLEVDTPLSVSEATWTP